MNKGALLKEAEQAIIDGNEDLALEVAKKTVAEGLDPVEMINKGYTAGMHRISRLFDREEIPLPTVLIAAEAMKRGIDYLGPHIPRENTVGKRGTVVMGTIEGDIHDIGKRIVVTMLRVAGFQVVDLGRDVPIQAFVDKAKELKADIIGSSTLMTTTMVGQKNLEEELRKAGLRDKIKTMVGGAATTPAWAQKIGADAYGEDSRDAVAKAKELIFF